MITATHEYSQRYQVAGVLPMPLRERMMSCQLTTNEYGTYCNVTKQA